MAKKKNPAPWSMGTTEAESAAKESIRKTTTTKETVVPKAPKKKVGRPKQIKEAVSKILVFETARKLAKKVSAMNEITMTEYISHLIIEDAKKKGIK